MKSQWYALKSKAIAYRKKGYSLRMVEEKLGIRRSTLSGWFKEVSLTTKQQAKLLKNWKFALGKARIKAVQWHNTQKQMRLQQARDSALTTLESLDTKQKNLLELALAMLYLGEGFKSRPQTGIGSSNALILKFFIKALKSVYNLGTEKIKCELHLRADQKPLLIKKYWSKELNIPLENFTSVSIDVRTKGSKTYDHYKGVCVLQCSNAAIQRRLLYLADEFCNKVILQ
ncbi:MAG TPA: hypothetical protein VE973_03895 [Candidatus Limnocylindria bacterium]|nr:hypothetical protein [Candidatus Limnocylindria bacterium]